MHAVDRETFEALRGAAVAALPEAFRERIENVRFIVEDRAGRDDLGLTGPGRRRQRRTCVCRRRAAGVRFLRVHHGAARTDLEAAAGQFKSNAS